LDVLGKRGMLAIWSFIIVVQVYSSAVHDHSVPYRVNLVRHRCSTMCGCLSRCFCVCTRQCTSRITLVEENESSHSNACQCSLASDLLFCYLRFSRVFRDGFYFACRVSVPMFGTRWYLSEYRSRASVIGLYTSYVAPIFLRITSGRDKLVPGPFTLGRWYTPIGMISVAWVIFIVVLLLFPPGQAVGSKTMSKVLPLLNFVHTHTDSFRLRYRSDWCRVRLCLCILDSLCPQVVHWTD